MAEFAKVMQQANRMCASHEECSGCPAFDVCVFDTCILKSPIEVWSHEKFERITINWAKEYLEPQYPTWHEWSSTNFPDSEYYLTPCDFMPLKKVEKLLGMKCAEIDNCGQCLKLHIPADIAEKLGIKPKERADV